MKIPFKCGVKDVGNEGEMMPKAEFSLSYMEIDGVLQTECEIKVGGSRVAVGTLKNDNKDCLIWNKAHDPTAWGVYGKMLVYVADEDNFDEYADCEYEIKFDDETGSELFKGHLETLGKKGYMASLEVMRAASGNE